MQAEETKHKRTKAEGTDFGCCKSQNFQKMFDKMGNCFPDRGDTMNFSTMKARMIKKMMEMCYPPETADTKEETELQKEKERETESFEKKGCSS